jgi:protein involved in polysaccharide export with SLBB domain
VIDGFPVRRLPPELLFGNEKDGEVSIPLSLLSQEPPAVYRLGPGDVLGVYIEGVLGERDQPLPTHFPETPRVTPSIGYPIPVREDGTLSLPLVPPFSVEGRTLAEAEQGIISAYTVTRKILTPGRERVLVTLQQRRTNRVLVLRQESGGFDTTPEGIAGVVLASSTSKRGNGHVIDLPAFENDILSALARTGGLPGLDTYDSVIVFRHPSPADLAVIEEHANAPRKDPKHGVPAGLSCPIVVIPLRAKPGHFPVLRPEDILLNKGDVVFLEARDLDVFYAAGLLPPGEYVLPRDRDLNVIEAIAMIRGPAVSGAFNVVNAIGPVLSPGIGFPNPSLLTVLRRLPQGGEVRIRVDLNKALREPQERLIVKPKDVLVLQETPGEAFGRYLSEMFHLDLTYRFVQSSRATGTFTGTVP